MPRRSLPLLSAMLLALAGCGGAESATTTPARVASVAATATPAAPVTAATLVRVPDGATAQRRLAFVDLEALARSDTPVTAAAVTRAVLEAEGAERVSRLPAGAVRTAVQVGGATILRGPGARAVSGATASPPDGAVVGARGALVRALAVGRPSTSAITPLAQSAVQSCLGATLAQTTLGPAAMGRDAALGVGLAVSGDRPAGVQLRICGAPRLVRDLHAMETALRRRFGALVPRGAVIGETEIGEREIVSATLPADALDPGELRRLLAADRGLRSLAWR